MQSSLQCIFAAVSFWWSGFGRRGGEQPHYVQKLCDHFGCWRSGSIIACYTVEIPYVGRKGTMTIAIMFSGIFLFLFTISADSDYQLAFSSIEAFFQNITYGVLYAYTPEMFPASNRGTGTGISSFSLCAPIIAANIPNANPNVPVFVSVGLILAAFVAMVFLPIETRGKQML